MLSDHDRAVKVELCVREYSNESKVFPCKKIKSFSQNSVYLPFHPARCRGGCLLITIAPWKLKFTYGNMQISLKAFLLKKRISLLPNYVPVQPPQRRSSHYKPCKLNLMHKNMQMNLKHFILTNNLFLLNTIRTSLKKPKKSWNFTNFIK